jgi:uncharacterized membrane protein
VISFQFEKTATGGHLRSPLGAMATALVIALILIAGVAFSWDTGPLAQTMAAIFIICALVHASFTYGVRNALVLFAICVVISFATENLGSATGFPFGHYHFAVGAALPHIGLIPIIVGPLWFGGGYFAWVVASILLDGADRRLDQTFNLVALPIVTAFVLTQWDLVMDPPSATIAKAWIWHNGGGDFGVPLSNYAGWLLNAWLFSQAFALYLRPVTRQKSPPHSRALALVAILFYLSVGLTHIVPWLMGQSGDIVDAAGHVWRIADIRETTVAVMIFTMGFTALLAVLRVMKKP